MRDVVAENGLVIYDVPDDITDEQAIADMGSSTRSVVAPDGTIIDEVPMDVTDQQALKDVGFIVDEEVKGDPTTGTTRDFLESTAVGFSEVGGNILELGADAAEFVGAEGIAAVLNKASSDQELAAEFFRKRTEDSPVASTVGELTPILASYIGGGGALFNGLRAVGTSGFTAGVASGIVTDQLLADSDDDNLFNLASEYLPESSLAPMFDFLSASEDDTVLEGRMKLLAEGMIAGGIVGSVFDTPLLAKVAKNTFGKAFDKLNVEEKVKVITDTMRNSRGKEINPEAFAKKAVIDPETGKVRFQTPEERASKEAIVPKQILNQNNSLLSRIKQQVFTSRGYLEPEVHNAFEGSQAAKRQLTTRAEHIANRIKITMDKMSSKDYDTNIANMNRAFNEGVEFLNGVKPEDRARVFSEYHELDLDVGEELLEARDLIDDLSRTIVGSDVPTKELKEIIQDNMGKYMRRSYRLFEDGTYKPDDNVRASARGFLTKQNLKNGFNPEEAESLADAQILDILGESNLEDRTYFDAVNKINKDILKQRKEIPEEIRNLMGEIKEPTDNIVLTVSKMAEMTETYRYLDSLAKHGKDKYIFASTNNPNIDMFNSKITGTNSSLDGMYTTPEILTSIKNRESKLLDLNNNSAFTTGYRRFLAAKGFSQKAKTIYSHVTHLRNGLGGVQFGIANGINPFGSEWRTTASILKNEIKLGGDKAMNEVYEKYQKLGIINTNVRVNEFRELMDDAFGADQDQFLKSIENLAGRYGAVKEADRITEQLYMATDDYFKINNFHNELEVLKEAFPDRAKADLAGLELEAAQLTKNTFPNYDRVPKGIKKTRELPIGNFVAFPAEIARTSFHIIKQASKEINSGNAVLRARGMKRAAGYFGSTIGWYGLSQGTAALSGLSQEEKEAIDVMTETPWSKDSPRNYIRGDDGKIFANDIQFLDSYSYVKEPLIAVMSEIYNGNLQGKDLDEYMANAFMAGAKKILSPYVSGSILTTAITDIAFAAADSQGRTPDGKIMFTPGLSTFDKSINGFTHLVSSLLPGSLNSAEGLWDGARENVDKHGNVKNVWAEMGTNFTGVKFAEVRPEFTLEMAAKGYVRQSSDTINMRPDFEATGEDLTETYISMHKNEYRLQQDLYKKVSAAATLIGRGKALLILEEAGVTGTKAAMIMSGYFVPSPPTMDTIVDIELKTFGKIRNDLDRNETTGSTVRDIYKAYSDMLATSLESFDKNVDEEDNQVRGRLLKAEGGLVDIPNAPAEPDERINKITGRPYNADAGDLLDDDDPLRRLGFVEGGWVTREQYAVGGLVKKLVKKFGPKMSKIDEQAAIRASQSLEADPILDEDLVSPFRVSYMNSNSTISPARQERGGTYTKGNYDDILPIGSKEAQELIEKGLVEPTEGATHILAQNVSKRTLDDSEVYDTKYAAVTPEDINLMYGDERRSLYTSKSKISDEDYSNEWRTIDDADIYGNVIPQGRQASEYLASKTGIRTDVMQTLNDFIIPEKYKEEFFYDAKEYGFTPEFIQDIEDSVKPVPRAKVGMVAKAVDKDSLKEFVSKSKVQVPVFRATQSDEINREVLVSMYNPNEIGTHVGATSTQANSILAKGLSIDPSVPDGVSTRVSDAQVDAEFRRVTKDNLEEGEMQKANIGKYYVNLENPLVINDDVSNWDARAIIASMRRSLESSKPASIDDLLAKLDADPDFWEEANIPRDYEDDVLAYITERASGELDEDFAAELAEVGIDLDTVDYFADSYGIDQTVNDGFIDAMKSQGVDVDLEELNGIYDGSIEEATNAIMGEESSSAGAYIADVTEKFKVNRAFREYLKSKGFDSIDYKNLGEATSKEGSDRSYIIFDPEQIKSATSSTFDKTDKRVQKYKGGRVKARLKKKLGGIVKAAPVQGQESLDFNTPIAGGTLEGTNKAGLNTGPNEVPIQNRQNAGFLGRSLHRKFN